MRIGIDARFYSGETAKGLGRYTEQLLHYLHKELNGHELVVFCHSEAKTTIQRRLPKAQLVPADAKWYSLAEQREMPKIIDAQHLDLVHIPHFNVPVRLKTPFVVTIHDLILTKFPTIRATTLGPIKYAGKQAAYKFVIQQAVRRSKGIITVSHFSEQDIIREFGVSPEKVHVTYEAADPPALWPVPNDIVKTRNKYGIGEDYILYVGNAYPHKNLELFIEVAKRWNGKPLQFVMIGKADYFYERFMEVVKASGMSQQFVFTGFAPDEDLAPLYAGAAAYVFPSKYEGFGLPPLEAMQVETPVAASNGSSLPEVLQDGALYFDPNDVYGIISAIDRLVSNPSFARALAKRGRKIAESYSWEKMARETLGIYEQITSKSKEA